MPEDSWSFFLFLCLAAFLTNQFHKWAHMDVPPAFVGWLQAWGVILSRDHHDIHHESPYDTYYCITAGFWNPLLDRTRFFERAERLIRNPHDHFCGVQAGRAQLLPPSSRYKRHSRESGNPLRQVSASSTRSDLPDCV